jgi:hypothetical protein
LLLSRTPAGPDPLVSAGKASGAPETAAKSSVALESEAKHVVLGGVAGKPPLAGELALSPLLTTADRLPPSRTEVDAALAAAGLNPVRKHDGIRVLGVPVGTDAFERAFASEGVESVASGVLSKLPLFRDRQSALLLLRLVATSKLSFLLRGLPPENMAAAAAAHDANVRSCFSALFQYTAQNPLPDRAWDQATLPIRPGLGLTPAVFLSPIAYAASFAKFERLFPGPGSRALLPWFTYPQLPPESTVARANAAARVLLARYAAAPAAADKSLPPTRLDRTSQSSLASAANGERLSAFLGTCSPADRVRVDSLSGFGAMSMFYALPSCPELVVPPHLMPPIISFVLGTDFPLQLPLTCACNDAHPLDRRGVHLMSCAANGKIQTHNSVQRVLRDMARAAGHSVTETQGLANIHPDGSHKKPDLNIHTLLTNGADNYVDLTFPYPLSASVVAKIRHPLHHAEMAAKEKVAKHGAAVEAFGGRFWPFVVEAFGSFGKEARELFSTLAAEIAPEDFVSPNWAALSVRAYWKQVFSVALFARHARSMLCLRQKAINRRSLPSKQI